MKSGVKERIIRSVKEILPKTAKTCLWLIKLTVSISLVILFLRYFNILSEISAFLDPVMGRLGLPGEAALAYVSGYFVNVYSAIAVMTTLDMDIRAVTILSVMILCSHNMIIETVVQKKTGSSAVRIVFLRTFSAFFLAVVLNKIMPQVSLHSVQTQVTANPEFGMMLREWCFSTLKMIVKMSVLIFSLSILQRLLSEFGIIRYIARFLRPVLLFFGLPAKTSFLWIVANILGLAYGAAVMIDEYENGKVSAQDNDLLNHHISISHSNLEDLMLLASIGALPLWMLFSRWFMSFILVWERRLELLLRKKSQKLF